MINVLITCMYVLVREKKKFLIDMITQVFNYCKYMKHFKM